MSDRKQHPSGRPIRQRESRDYSMIAHRMVGFRCPRLNAPYIQQATDTHAIGFVDWRVREAQEDWERREYLPEDHRK